MTPEEYLAYERRLRTANSVEELRRVVQEASARHPDDLMVSDLGGLVHYYRIRLELLAEDHPLS